MTRPIPPQHRKKYRPKHRIDGTFKVSKRHKYNAKGRHIDGKWFASKAEGDRYEQLAEMQRMKLIEQLVCQPSWQCHVKGQLVCTYRADFSYTAISESGVRNFIIEDVKGMRTEAYKIKKKLVEALHGITIVEVAGAKVKTGRYLNGVEINKTHA